MKQTIVENNDHFYAYRQTLSAMKLILVAALCLSATQWTAAQPATSPADTLPFRQIPDYPPTYTAKTILVRMIDGLGFRYYWATDNLTGSDLAYRPSPKARTTEETIAISWTCLLSLSMLSRRK